MPLWRPLAGPLAGFLAGLLAGHGPDPCTGWGGITCNSQGSITEMYASFNIQNIVVVTCLASITTHYVVHTLLSETQSPDTSFDHSRLPGSSGLWLWGTLPSILATLTTLETL